jgi:hypothetical protein
VPALKCPYCRAYARFRTQWKRLPDPDDPWVDPVACLTCDHCDKAIGRISATLRLAAIEIHFAGNEAAHGGLVADVITFAGQRIEKLTTPPPSRPESSSYSARQSRSPSRSQSTQRPDQPGNAGLHTVATAPPRGAGPFPRCPADCWTTTAPDL